MVTVSMTTWKSRAHLAGAGGDLLLEVPDQAVPPASPSGGRSALVQSTAAGRARPVSAAKRVWQWGQVQGHSPAMVGQQRARRPTGRRGRCGPGGPPGPGNIRRSRCWGTARRSRCRAPPRTRRPLAPTKELGCRRCPSAPSRGGPWPSSRARWPRRRSTPPGEGIIDDRLHAAGVHRGGRCVQARGPPARTPRRPGNTTGRESSSTTLTPWAAKASSASASSARIEAAVEAAHPGVAHPARAVVFGRVVLLGGGLLGRGALGRARIGRAGSGRAGIGGAGVGRADRGALARRERRVGCGRRPGRVRRAPGGTRGPGGRLGGPPGRRRGRTGGRGRRRVAAPRGPAPGSAGSWTRGSCPPCRPRPEAPPGATRAISLSNPGVNLRKAGSS